MSAETPLSESVAQRLREEILVGRYQPGQRLPGERDLASRLSVGRAAVREALRALEQWGLVAVRRGGGATVLPVEDASVEIVPHLLFAGGELDRELAFQLLDVHEMLVSGAARLAVERGREDDLLEAREILARVGREGLPPEERARHMDALLDLVTRASGNLVLRLARRAVGPGWQRKVSGLLWGPYRPPRDALDRCFRDLDAAIATRDPAATEEAVRRLLRLRRGPLLRALEDPEIARALASPGSPEDDETRP